MINKTQLALLLKNNNIDEATLEDKLYHTFILGVFEALCKGIIANGSITEEKERFRKYSDKTIAVKRLVEKYTGCIMSQPEYDIMANYIHAFFAKETRRKSFETAFRQRLLDSQGNECAICKAGIDLSTSHLDHIIPFKYTGDILPDNYQMLCETCNSRKGTAAYYEISMLLLNRKNT